MVLALGVIPARFASSRFPGKPLAPIGSRTMIEHVWRGVTAARRLQRVIVATEDARIVEACRGFGAEVMLTSPDHASGTDRVAEVVRRLETTFDVVVNVQGDEPLITGTSLDALVGALENDPDLEMATLAEPLGAVDEIFEPGVVKIVMSAAGKALYFSRAPIPFYRAPGGAEISDFREAVREHRGWPALYLKHQGVYAFRSAALLRFTSLGPSRLERCESLEQLRALEAGFAIKVVSSDFRSIAVDTPQDLERATARLSESKEVV